MSLDGAFIFILKKELSSLIDSRVDKIHMPSKDEIIISFRTREGLKRLLMSANPSSARVCLTKNAPENPPSPPMLCMLMRKHLANSRLTDIKQINLERILFFEFEGVNEIGDVVNLSLILEIMGRHSNIILVKDGKIIDAVKRISDDISSVRRVLPSGEYILPPRSERLSLTQWQPNREELLKKLQPFMNKKLDKALISVFEGISPIVAREIVNYSCRDISMITGELSNNNYDRLIFFLKKIKAELFSDINNFTVVKDLNGRPKDFTFIDIEQYGTEMINSYEKSASSVVDNFFSESARQDRLKQRSSQLQKMLLNTYERILRRLENQKQELIEAENKEKYKIWADIVSANLYSIKKGQKSLKAIDFYTGENVEIPLDERLSPIQNVQKLYHEYKKLEHAKKALQEQIISGEQELIYIDSVFDAVSRASGDSVINEIRNELAEQGYIKYNKTSKVKQKPLPPLKFISEDGFEILAGRNNRQNDELTLKTAKQNDLWLHTKDIAGSHVIIKSNDKDIPPSTINQAAVIAAYCSKASESSQVPVDVVKARFVKKPSKAKPGMVIFTNNKTMFVKPDRDLYIKLLTNDK